MNPKPKSWKEAFEMEFELDKEILYKIGRMKKVVR